MVIASISAPLIAVWKSVFGKPRPNTSLPVNGFTTEEYSQIRQHFKTLLDDDREGMALAVYVDNQLVVDLWGGMLTEVPIDYGLQTP
uniref:Beta-lactamase-related domain-containing protein n=1 Tax=Ditylenchus dipsaci TaxID=166011 RepID=A0A915DVT2_9BILA